MKLHLNSLDPDITKLHTLSPLNRPEFFHQDPWIILLENTWKKKFDLNQPNNGFFADPGHKFHFNPTCSSSVILLMIRQTNK